MNKHKKTIVIVSIALLLVIGAAAFYYVRSQKADVAVTTSKSSTAQPSYKSGDSRTSNQGGGTSQGGAVDTGGTNVPVEKVGISSESGLITVKQPSKDDLIASGDVLSGTVKGLSKVQYRVIDESVGVLAQGSLSVVNNAFSGALQFKSRAQTGRIDVFSFDASGAEINSIEIPIGFKN